MHRPGAGSVGLALVAAGLALVAADCAWWVGRGRVYTSPDNCTHLGVRVHTDLEGAAGTIQWTREWAPCRLVYPPDAGTVGP